MSTHYLSDWYCCRRDGISPKRLSVFSSRTEIIKSSLKSFVTTFFSFARTMNGGNWSSVEWSQTENIVSEIFLCRTWVNGVTASKLWMCIKCEVTIDSRFMPQVNGLPSSVWLRLLSLAQAARLTVLWVASSHHSQKEHIKQLHNVDCRSFLKHNEHILAEICGLSAQQRKLRQAYAAQRQAYSVHLSPCCSVHNTSEHDKVYLKT